jgi:UV DNA damage endonuclease
MRFGYCCIALGVENCSTAKTVTVKTLLTIEESSRLDRLRRVARENLANTKRLLWYNQAHDIGLYRFSSQLIPLATHPVAGGWDYLHELREELEEVGQVVNQTGIRVSAHPGQYCVINTLTPLVWENSLKDLEYHHGILSQMKLNHNACMVLHVGGAYRNKPESLRLFKERFTQIPGIIRNRICIENDDRNFTLGEVLSLAGELQIPMVLDLHHHWCNNQGEDLKDNLPAIYATWGPEIPKIHISSPRLDRDPRAHADFVNPEDFQKFLALNPRPDIDVMIEAKMKDLAVIKLREDLKKCEV